MGRQPTIVDVVSNSTVAASTLSALLYGNAGATFKLPDRTAKQEKRMYSHVLLTAMCPTVRTAVE